jgi:hypothetical protein
MDHYRASANYNNLFLIFKVAFCENCPDATGGADHYICCRFGCNEFEITALHVAEFFHFQYSNEAHCTECWCHGVLGDT